MFQQGGFGPIPGQVHHFLARSRTKRTAATALERYMKETRRLYGVMDKRLAEREFFAGRPYRSPISRSSAGHGGIRGTRSISPTFRTSSAGTKR